MQVDVREIINVPGERRFFDYEPSPEGLETGAVAALLPGWRAFGVIENRAGVLHLEGTLEAAVTYECSRCLKAVDKTLTIPMHAVLVERESTEEPDAFLIVGGMVDVDEIVFDAFILNADDRFLCSEDCKGLCSRCGADLNEGPCGCEKEIDPRLAVLRQLLETD